MEGRTIHAAIRLSVRSHNHIDSLAGQSECRHGALVHANRPAVANNAGVVHLPSDDAAFAAPSCYVLRIHIHARNGEALTVDNL